MESVEAYRCMCRIRVFEEVCMALHRDGEITGSIHLCVGQEAIPVGACNALHPGDAVTATYRGHGWAIARGVPLADLFAEIIGRSSALCGGRGGSAYLSSAAHGFLGENSIVGGGVPMAVGAALAAKHAKSSAVSLAAVGDGALNQGAAHEALNLAAAFQLPFVLVVENNKYSEMTPIEDMVRVSPLSRRADAYGMPGVTVDGNDAETVKNAVGDAVDRARHGHGPSLVEALTERLVGHYSGDAQQYRPKGEVEAAREREPLARLRGSAAGDAELLEALDNAAEQARREVQAALTAAMSYPLPDPATARKHTYA